MTTTKKAIGIFSSASIVVLFAVTWFMPSASATDVYSGGSIQAAINAAIPGETITVHDGTYKENLVVNKSDIVIRSANGSAVTIISSNQTDTHVVNITDQTNVTLEGFTIRDTNGTTGAGIYMRNTRDSRIINNDIVNISTAYGRGIRLDSSDNNSFVDTYINEVEGNGYVVGINLVASNDNTFYSTIVDNVAGNWSNGIELEGAHNNSFADTNISGVNGNVSAVGIQIADSDNNTFDPTVIERVTATGAGSIAYGIMMWRMQDGRFTDTTILNITGNVSAYGIVLFYSGNNNFAETSIANLSCEFAYGVFLNQSDNNSFKDTAVTSLNATDDAYGIYLLTSNNNTFDPTVITNITAGNIDAFGVYLDHSHTNNFTDITVSDVNGARIATGIYLYASGNNNLELTNIELVGAGNLYAHGLHLSHANYNHFFATAINDIQGHLTYGIFFSEAENNTCDSTRIKNITSDGPDAFGINMDSSQYNTFTETDIMAVSSGENVAYGICFAYAHNNIVTRARIVSTEQARIDCAVYLWDSRKNTINESDIRNNGHGFRLNQSDNNIIERNMIVNNTALAISGLSLSTGSDNNEIHENCFYYNGYEFRQASDDGSQNNLDRNYWEPPPGPLGDPYRIFGDAMNRDRDPLAFCPLCAVEAPALTPTGLIALVSLLSAIAAVTIVRKRR